jgi:hypothetical protein
MSEARAGAGDIVRLLGEMDAVKLAAIERAGATLRDLEEVAAWLAGEDDVMGELERPLSGVAAQVYEILTADEPADDEP